MTYSSKQIIKMLEKDGWHRVSCVGSHHQFKHPVKPGRVTVPHPKQIIPIGTARYIFKQAGINPKETK